MPLHLLGKKSWNVYNQENIDRVRRDEAAAQLREKETQRRADDADAESRLQILRGAQQEGLRSYDQDQIDQRQPSSKKRKLGSENETDRDMRLAQQALSQPTIVSRQSKPKELSLTGADGHINLFLENDKPKSRKNEELAAETAKKQQEVEDQYTMRLANAAGRHQQSERPWYNAQSTLSTTDLISKDASDDKDRLRREREKKRLDSNDPLAAMKRGVKQLREADKSREEWRAQRERDLEEVEELAMKNRHVRKRRRSDEDSLEGFDLERGYERDRSERRRKPRESERHRRHHSHGSRSHKHHRRRSKERVI